MPARARSSAGVPSARIRPSRIRRRRSQRSASSITWVETRSVEPASARRWNVAQSSRRSRLAEADGRLVEHEQVRRAEQRHRQRGARPLASGQVTDERAGERFEPHQLRHLGDAVAPVQNACEIGEVLTDGQVAVHRRCLRHVADGAAQLGRARPARRTRSQRAARRPGTRMSVVLPQPLGPRRPVTELPAAAQSISRRTSRPPRRTSSFETTIAASVTEAGGAGKRARAVRSTRARGREPRSTSGAGTSSSRRGAHHRRQQHGPDQGRVDQDRGREPEAHLLDVERAQRREDREHRDHHDGRARHRPGGPLDPAATASSVVIPPSTSSLMRLRMNTW